ncbi:MAG: hypothetical protein HKP58_09115, partial [Desulfatitalea sp.]|nr:hypothetical protein [Desulfatitalea sp.]
MSRYMKYALNEILELEDGFCNYRVQNRHFLTEEILDVTCVIFFDEEDAEAMLWDCVAHDPLFTIDNLRYFLAHECMENFIFKMDDRRVVRETAKHLVLSSYRVVLEPGHGWAVGVDEATGEPRLPLSMGIEPDVDNLLAQINHLLDDLVAGQRKKYNAYETQLAGLTEAEQADLYAQDAGGGLWDATGGGLIDMIQAAPGAVVRLVKAFPGISTKYLKTLQRIALMPARLGALTAESIMTGSTDPLEAEIDGMVKPLVNTYEEALRYKSMLGVLFTDEQTMELLQDFAQRYWEATHPLERTAMGASAAADIVVTIVLAVFTAGVGAAANVAAKSARLSRLAELLEKLAKMLKRTGHREWLPKKGRPGAIADPKKTSKGAKSAKGMPGVDDPPKKVDDLVDGDGKKAGGDKGKDDAPKRKHKPPGSLNEAVERLADARKRLATQGFTPKYTDSQLKAIAAEGKVDDRFVVRFMESRFDKSDGHLGLKKDGKVSYWSTTFDQIENADT